MSQQKKEYTIFNLPNYLIKKNDDDSFKCKTYTEPIDKILKKLEKDKGYHIRITGDEPCILFGDLDHIPTEEIFNNFILLLCSVFTVNIESIYYTLSIKKNEFSYHWTIPTIEATPKIIKQKLEKKTFDEFRAFIDVSIYKKHWFRLPNQTNTDKPLTHNIIKGEMKNFLIHYIDNCEEELTEEQPTEEPTKQPTEEPTKQQTKKPTEEPTEEPKKEYIMKFNEGKTKEQYIEKLIDILDDSRADDNKEWFEVSCIINNELSTDIKFIIFEKFSRRSSKFNKEKDIKWLKNLSIKKDGLRIGSLIEKVKEDNITEYELLKKEFINDNDILFKKTFNGSEKYLSEYIIQKYLKNNFICVLLKPCKFHFFNGNRWTEDKSNNKLFNIIINDLQNEYLEYKNNLTTSKEDDDERKLINKILCKLNGKLSFIDGVIEWISRLLFNIDILKYFDENPDLMGFNNGVYVFSTKTFRQSKPTDFITKSTGYDFPTDEKGYKPAIDLFLKQVFPDEEVKNYVLQLQAQSLCGYKIKDLVLTHTGRGGNGKSILIKILSEVFGDYFIEIPPAMITCQNKGSHNTPDPFLSEIQGCRYATANEPKSGLKLNDSIIKIFGSQENVKYRMLFSNDPITLKTQIKTNIYCNNKLSFDGQDGGLIRRLKVIKYISKFDEKPNEENNIYKIDYTLDKKVKDWREDYMKMLITIYDPNYSYSEPPLISKWSGEYCDDNNDVKKFVEDYCEFTNSKADYLLIKNLKELYKTNKEYDQTKLKNLKEFLEKEMNTTVLDKGKIKINNKWTDVRSVIFGWKLKKTDDDSDDDEPKCGLDV